MSARTDSISFESIPFALHGRKVNDLDWYEFEVRIANERFREVGGETKQRFIENLIAVLASDHGTPLSKLDTHPYAEFVGGTESEYLGQISFSGYHTLYFFKREGELRQVVFADSHGKLLAHTKLPPELHIEWIEELRRLRSSSGLDTISQSGT